jgi:hypothetical protein
MQNRHFLGEVDSVKALNLIDTVFHDVPTVRDAWANLFSALNDQRNFPPTGPIAQTRMGYCSRKAFRAFAASLPGTATPCSQD